MPRADGNKLVNRQVVGTYQGKMHQRSAGLLLRESDTPTELPGIAVAGPINRHRCPGDIVPISSLIPDPVNARLHPEKNVEAIKHSLNLYGQLKPVVVRRETNVVVAGNGTMEAAVALGWTTIAINCTDLSEIEAVGYGLADNKTAELAKWDFEVVARLDKFMLEADHPTIGWTMDELEVLRQADWTPPASTAGDSYGEGEKPDNSVEFTDEQWLAIQPAIDQVNMDLFAEGVEPIEEAEAIQIICLRWLEAVLERVYMDNQTVGAQ